MARDAVAITAVAAETPVVLPSTTAITPANGQTIAAVKDTTRLMIVINNTTVTAKKVTIKAGVNPPALRQGLGDLVLTVEKSTTEVIFVESARHMQADGSISIDNEAGMTGFISALRCPKGV